MGSTGEVVWVKPKDVDVLNPSSLIPGNVISCGNKDMQTMKLDELIRVEY